MDAQSYIILRTTLWMKSYNNVWHVFCRGMSNQAQHSEGLQLWACLNQSKLASTRPNTQADFSSSDVVHRLLFLFLWQFWNATHILHVTGVMSLLPRKLAEYIASVHPPGIMIWFWLCSSSSTRFTTRLNNFFKLLHTLQHS